MGRAGQVASDRQTDRAIHPTPPGPGRLLMVFHMPGVRLDQFIFHSRHGDMCFPQSIRRFIFTLLTTPPYYNPLFPSLRPVGGGLRSTSLNPGAAGTVSFFVIFTDSVVAKSVRGLASPTHLSQSQNPIILGESTSFLCRPWVDLGRVPLASSSLLYLCTTLSLSS